MPKRSTVFQRDAIKSKLSVFKLFINNPENNTKIIEIQERLKQFERLYDKFDEKQVRLESCISSEDVDLIALEALERSNFENEYFHLLAKARALISGTAASSSIQEEVKHFIPSSIVKQLPSITVPKFDGNLSKWIKFRDSFISLVHSQSIFSNVDKFNYLNQALEGEAARVISSLGISEANYEHAWNRLKSRYEDTQELIDYHTKALCEIKPMATGSTTDLRRIIDDATNHLAALAGLGEATNTCDSLLIYLLSKAVDEETKNQWNRQSLSMTGKRTFDDFKAVLENHCKLLQKSSADKQYSTVTAQKGTSSIKVIKKQGERAVSHTTISTTCPQCKEKHGLYACDNFKALDVPARVECVKRLGLCFNCLKSGHQSKTCPSGHCRNCNRRHNSLLHLEKVESIAATTAVKATTTSSSQLGTNQSTKVLLGTVLVDVQDHDGNSHECRALLDSGSQVHFITEDFCKRLKITKMPSGTTISGIHQRTIDLRYKTLLKFKSRTSGFKASITCLIAPKITENMPNIKIDKQCIEIPHGITLADPHFDKDGPVDMLIGAGLFWDLLCIGQIQQNGGQFIFQKTKLGWIATGHIHEDVQQRAATASCHMVTNTELHKQVEQFWTMEETTTVGGAPALDPLDASEQHFIATTTINKTGRFIVSIPFNENKEKLDGSYHTAHKRLMSMERKFNRCPEIKQQYIKFMEEYHQLGHMDKVSQQELDEDKPAYYLPHHAVFKEQSTTTKLRVVFDGSTRTTSGLSLNDIQHPGYEVQDELICILLRFRKHKYVIAADIAKMYRQILIREEERSYQRILWRTNILEEMQIYHLNTVTYGTRAAAFLAKRCLRQVGEETKQSDPQLSKIIISDFYVDDLLTGTETIAEARNIKARLTETLARRGFELRKWASNNPQAIEEDHVAESTITIEKDPKTLGLKWSTDKDELCITIKSPENPRVTKRTILSQISQIFDPLGLVAPITVRAKVILQKVWQLQLTWDESLPQDINTVWETLRQQLSSLNSLRIPRRALGEACNKIQLHGFSDASESAYGACVYLKSLDDQENNGVHLLCARSRVAPLKKLTLPRLELCAALLLAQLSHKAIKALDIEISDQYYWSDSTITLAWIRGSSSRWKTFVSNRTAEIQRLTNNNWLHVMSKDNPADLVSRGVDPAQLVDSSLWWHGPPWLSQDQSKWPRQNDEIIENPLEERVKQQAVLTTTTEIFDIFTRYSSWSRLVRIIAYCLRFKHKLRGKTKNNEHNEFLTTREQQSAEICLLKLVQAQSFSLELKTIRKGGRLEKQSKLISLSPFIDKVGLLRVGGRLEHASINFNQKHPIILPTSHQATWLIIAREHKRLLHAGYEAVIASLRMKYWPIGIRSMVKKVVKKCIVCARHQAITVKYIMGNLPATRVTPTPPFFVCGVDYAGPLYLKEKLRNRTAIKAYVCIFVCFSTKAVHIELAHDLSTDAFLNCLRRFISRRGRCQRIYSDNGLNFVGARNQFKELGYLLTEPSFQSKVASFSLKEQITWHMNPPYAPHFGGLWESAVKSCKFHLKRVIGETRLTYEEMYTVLTEIEACLNSRPMYPLSNDPNDLSSLTPSHFLIGRPLMALPEADVRDVPINRLSRYQHLQYMVQHFWQRWQKEYLHSLQQKPKWYADAKIVLKPGTMVVIKDENLPPTRWRLGRIVSTYPGTDQGIRVLSIKTVDGIITRSVTKIVPLPVEIEVDQHDDDSLNPAIITTTNNSETAKRQEEFIEDGVLQRGEDV